MKAIIILLLFTINAFAECNMERPSFARNVYGFSTTRHYILHIRGDNIQTSLRGVVISGEWDCLYTNKHIKANNKEEVRNKVEIDHVLPWDFFKRNAKNCKRALEFFNDEDNLIPVDKTANREKSDSTDYIGYRRDVKVIACNTCIKYELDNCKNICNFS